MEKGKACIAMLRNIASEVFISTLIGIAMIALGTPIVACAETTPPTIVIHAKRFAFVPSQITLKTRHTVQLMFISNDITHTIVVPGLGIDQIVRNGRPKTLVITPTTPGDFSGMCGRYCGAGHNKMKFVIHVSN